MPACHQENMLGPGSPRCGFVQLRARGVPFNVSVGGMALATFTGNEDVEVARLPRNTDVPLVWDDAVFYGRHWFLGPILIILPPRVSGRAAASGFVRSSQAASFFPAVNRNSFAFTINLPRFGITFTSEELVVNEAEISEIPPFGSEYKLLKPLRYSAAKRGRSLLAAALGDIVLETCTVKLMELRNIRVEVSTLAKTSTDVTFEARFLNETPEDAISVTWLVWPRPANDVPDSIGSIALRRTVRTVKFTLPRAIFASERQLAVALAKPFRTDAAAVAALSP